jgi:GT2 family glycosyltransferase
MFEAQEILTISIASKDRPEVVDATLQKIHAFGLGDCPLILCDDGSTPPLNPPALALFPQGRLLRNEMAQGQALARNRIARECTTPLLLQLDDDSYPVAGDFGALLKFAQQAEDWLAIAIPFEEPARGRSFPSGIPVDHSIQVKAFVGCSALFNVERFRSVGGYADWVGGMVEEEELSLRALSQGAGVLSIDLLRIRHEISETSRNRSKITRNCYQNWFLLWMLNGPWIAIPWRTLRLSLSAVQMTIRQGNTAALQGLFSGIKTIPSLWRLRTPASMNCYRKFRALPHALDFLTRIDR